MRWPWRRTQEQRAISFQDLWGSGADANAIRGNSIPNALTLAPVFAATRLIADAIASLPLQAFRKTGDQRQPVPTPALLSDPSMFGGGYEWVQRALVSLLLRGNAYGFVTQLDALGQPRQIEWLHPDEVSLADDRAVARPQWYWEGRQLAPWLGRDSTGELLHIPWYTLPGRIRGLSPIQAFASTIETGILAQRFGRDWFQNGAVPSAVLETEQAVNQEQAQLLKERFRLAAGGREPVVLGAGSSYKPIAVPPEDSQFLETIRANASTIAAIYGIYPAELIGGDTKDSMTYANVEQQSLNLVMHTLRPYTTKLEQHLSRLLPRPQFARFNFDALLRADLKSRYESHAIALQQGFKTVDEVREIEDLPPLPESEESVLDPEAQAAPPGEGEAEVVPFPRRGEA